MMKGRRRYGKWRAEDAEVATSSRAAALNAAQNALLKLRCKSAAAARHVEPLNVQNG